ncbi:hypothetical protein DSECCO2_556870 [anaerobic digester metagenome]
MLNNQNSIKNTREKYLAEGRIHLGNMEESNALVPQELQTLKMYMPLTVIKYEHYEWSDLAGDYPIELDSKTALSFHDEILDSIIKENMKIEKEQGLMKSYNIKDSISQKVQSLFFTVEQVGDELLGVAECKVHDNLSDVELEKLKNYVIGQASDGFGEKFEQRPIKVGTAEIYLNLWTDSKSWFIMTQEEIESKIQQMGGIHLE